MTIKERLFLVSKEVGLPIKKLYDFFFYLQEGDSIDNNSLVRLCGVSKNALNQTKELFSDIFEPSSQTTTIKKVNGKEVKELFSDGFIPDEDMWGFLKNTKCQETEKLLEHYIDLHPVPDRSYDQFTAMSQTTARRAALLNFFCDIEGKDIAFIGDDDFTSIAVANTNKAKSITVFEIDKRIRDAIRTIAQKENFKVTLVEYDARKKLPQQYREKYDVVFTDPPYTPDGIALFLSRGIDLLNHKNEAARIYVCYGNSDRAKERFIPIQKLFSDSGLMLRWVFDKFSRYFGAEAIGSTSSLYIADISAKTRAPIQGEFNENIYTI